MDSAVFFYGDGTEKSVPMQLSGNKITLAESAANARKVVLKLDLFQAESGEDGYYVMPNIVDRSTAGGIIRFRERPDAEQLFEDFRIPGFGIKKGDQAAFAVVTGGTFDFHVRIRLQSGKYEFLVEFIPAGEEPEILLLKTPADKADYAGMAEVYRQYQLDRGACRPLRERCQENTVLAESVKSPYIRIRMGWKPVPPPVLEQTPENEPEMFVAVDFDRACDILDACYARGIRHAEFCLVGWNCGGHDGAFPDLLPVEPALGGEEGLKKLAAKAAGYGYLLGAHTNLIDSYSLSRRACSSDRLIDADGSEHPGGQWAGGQSYYLCPERAYRFAREDFPMLKELGFNGPHYLDVATIVPPDPCFAEDHPLTRRQAAEWRGKSLALAREAFGASASEGSYDFAIGDYDYALYCCFRNDEINACPGGTEMSNFTPPTLCDEVLPFWNLVYHGIVTYNAHFRTVNAMVQATPDAALQNLAWGGRPAGYFHSKFRPQTDNKDAFLDASTPEKLAFGADRLAECAAEYSKLWHLQLEYMTHYRALAPKVSETEYADGTRVLVNYSDQDFQDIPAKTYQVISPEK